jgi:succinylarginine dihydrolase
MTTMSLEANFDGLPGPTHNYAGLSLGNLASTRHKDLVSNPKEAALQGLQKMKFLSDLGIPQGVIAPQERPDVRTLRSLGFSGTDAQVIAHASSEAPSLFTTLCSSSSMWTANAATVSPSADCADGRVHFTPANLSNKFHRSIEPETTSALLKAIFKDDTRFVHHAPLPTGNFFGDEGAANHTRLCSEYGSAGLELFVYGARAFEPGPAPKKFPARQSFEASAAVARRHQLRPEHFMLVQQNPDAIDAGIFHNDVVSVGNKNVFFFHEQAFVDQDRVIADLFERFTRITGRNLSLIEVESSQLSVSQVVSSYLFNSQLISVANDKMLLLVPSECEEIEPVRNYLMQLIETRSTPITQVKAFDLRQSMRNGGGPACLRLRVVLTKEELDATNQNVLMNDALYLKLGEWVNKYYRDRMTFSDLADPQLLSETRCALDELTQLLSLGSVYPFQA